MKNRISQIRKAKSFTQSQLADAANTSPRMIQYLERGQRDLTQNWMVRLGKALKVNPSSFIDESPDTGALPNVESEKLLGDVFEVIVSHARKNPELDSQLLAAIGKTVYLTALSGKLPKFKSGAPTAKRTLRSEAQRLVDYEKRRPN